MRRLLYWLGLANIVWTVDYDGAVRLRIVRRDVDGTRVVFGIVRDTKGELQRDGSITPHLCYMRKWSPYEQRPRDATRFRWERP